MPHVYARLRAMAQYLPWGLRKIARFLELYRTALIWPRPPFAGVYGNFSEVPGRSEVPPEAARMFAEHQLYFLRESPKLDAANGMPVLLQNHGLLPLIAAMLDRGTELLRILDFGGGPGIDFCHLPYATRLQNRISYTVVELPELCEAGRAAWINDDRIHFRCDLPPKGERFDIVYSSNAIQYAPDAVGLLQRFAGYAPRAILLTMTPMTQRKAFVRAQLTAETPFPVWVLSVREVEAAMRTVGYRLAAQMSENQDYNVDRYAPEYRVPNCAAVLFLPVV